MSLETCSHKTKRPIICGILTISDSRSKSDDKSGGRLKKMLEEGGHSVPFYEIVRDEIPEIQNQLKNLIENSEVELIVTTGGTGIAKRDSTLEAVRPFLHREIPGFGEIFRYLSYLDVGAPAMLSRATAGMTTHPKGNQFIFLLPGSANACSLAMEKLILPQMGHIFKEMAK